MHKSECLSLRSSGGAANSCGTCGVCRWSELGRICTHNLTHLEVPVKLLHFMRDARLDADGVWGGEVPKNAVYTVTELTYEMIYL